MKGLRFTEIKSHGFQSDFTRYQLWEHEIIPVQSTREDLWLPGRIIHHLKTRTEASAYFNARASQYDQLDWEVL